DRVRNLCILAHVDHGKTTLSDHLIGSNGLIHPRMQGELRYLDSREDEQARGITMKASAISLIYVPGAATRPEHKVALAHLGGRRWLKMDGRHHSHAVVAHVVAALRCLLWAQFRMTALSDDPLYPLPTAILNAQLKASKLADFKAAWAHRRVLCEVVEPAAGGAQLRVLVINKLDRLILELRLTPEEAYGRLRDIVTHANMVVSAFASERYLREADAVLAHEAAVAEAHQAATEAAEAAGTAAPEADTGGDEAAAAADADTFDPVAGSVAFGSAADGWAFRLDQFADMYAEKLGCKPEALVRAMWGDWAFSPKDKRVVPSARRGGGGGSKLKPMFVQFALEPIWKVTVLDSGEHVLGAAGEVHLGTCVKDLRERFAKVELRVSQPLVAFRESVFFAPEAPAPEQLGGLAGGTRPTRVVEAVTPNGCVAVRVRALPLPAGVAARAWLLGPKRTGPNLLLAPSAAAGTLFDLAPSAVVRAARGAAGTKGGAMGGGPGGPTSMAAAEAAATDAADAADAAAGTSTSAAAAYYDLRLGSPVAAVALGLVSETGVAEGEEGGGEAGGGIEGVVAAAVAAATAATTGGAAVCNGGANGSGPGGGGLYDRLRHVVASLESGVVAGYQIATASGPLCEEPLWGVAFELDVRLIQQPGQAQQAGSVPGSDGGEARGGGGEATTWSGRLDLQEEVYGPFSGQVMTTVAAACRRAVIEADARLVEAQYLCQLTAGAEALSGMYAVLGRRRSRILREEMREGSDTFLVSCYLPAEASFGLADEMRRRSSGAASASLMLSHWERLQVDPFFVPTTEEEREEHGEDGSGLTNLARRLIDAVRRRKGLPVEEKVVARATKQRTLKRNV
ncbi:Elongation factor Tu GTP-binding domain-containing protein 1, partial [Tetrabaena socialis]